MSLDLLLLIILVGLVLAVFPWSDESPHKIVLILDKIPYLTHIEVHEFLDILCLNCDMDLSEITKGLNYLVSLCLVLATVQDHLIDVLIIFHQELRQAEPEECLHHFVNTLPWSWGLDVLVTAIENLVDVPQSVYRGVIALGVLDKCELFNPLESV